MLRYLITEIMQIIIKILIHPLYDELNLKKLFDKGTEFSLFEQKN